MSAFFRLKGHVTDNVNEPLIYLLLLDNLFENAGNDVCCKFNGRRLSMKKTISFMLAIIMIVSLSRESSEYGSADAENPGYSGNLAGC